MIPLKNLLINNNEHKILFLKFFFNSNLFISNRLIHLFNIDYGENIKSIIEKYAYIYIS